MNSEVQLGKVLKDRVATKYYIENDKEKNYWRYRWQVFKSRK